MKDVLSFFLDWKVKLAAFFFFCIMAYSWHTVRVHNAVEIAKVELTIKLQKDQDKAVRELEIESDSTQKELKAKFDTQLKEKDAKYKTLNSKYSTLANSLSNRPDRDSSSKYGLSLPTGDRESPVFVDGSGLYRADAAFLIRYAVRTEGLKLELQACYKAYDTARDILERFKSEHQGM